MEWILNLQYDYYIWRGDSAKALVVVWRIVGLHYRRLQRIVKGQYERSSVTLLNSMILGLSNGVQE